MNYPSERKSPVKLSDTEKFIVYKHCMENRCINQIDSAVEYRVQKDKISREINILGLLKDEHGKPRHISSHHITVSVEAVVSWQKLIDKLPVMPVQTVELEQLKIYKAKTTKQIEEMKVQSENDAQLVADYKKEIERLKKNGAQTIVDRIRAIVSV